MVCSDNQVISNRKPRGVRTNVAIRRPGASFYIAFGAERRVRGDQFER